MAAKVSIITVVFNGKDFLPKTFESVFAQTFSSFEYIVIDGNSTDGTVDLIRQHEARFTRWISEPDKGLYDAMNKGIAMATGEYLLFMNAGDLFQDAEVLQRIFQNAPAEADVLYGETMMVDESGKELGTRSEVTPHRLPEKLSWKHFRYGMVVCHQSILIRRTLADSYNTLHPYCADIDWIVKALKKSNRVYNANLIVARFLKGGISDKRLKKSLKDRFAVLSEHFGYVPTLFAHVWISIRAIWFYKIRQSAK